MYFNYKFKGQIYGQRKASVSIFTNKNLNNERISKGVQRLS
jgi:hypothetical protein